MRASVLAVAAMLLTAAVAEAGLSKAAEEWRNGPDKFLFTEDDKKAWKAVRTDEEAAAFIDLFWARRDPTPGTSENEFREEFLDRVRYSDGAFDEKKRRGALSDRGQVYIVLGPPDEGTRAGMSISGPAGFSSSAGARSSESVEWTWTREEAKALGVPKLYATFNQAIGTETYVRDNKNAVFANVEERAVRGYVVDPELTEVPIWAERVSVEVLAATPYGEKKSAAGGSVGRLLLLRDLDSLYLDASKDPLASQTPAGEFAKGSSLAFVVEYCGAPGRVKLEAKIGKMIAASEVEPIAMKAVPGCGAVPSMLSLAPLPAGPHELQITITDANGVKKTVKQAFTVK
jgi:GWxTD domain-containing protein